MIDLTIVMAVYGQPLMLAHNLAEILTYEPEVRDHLNLIVVDDCGDPPVDPREIQAVSPIIKSAKLFRITEDIPWNQMGARNLGMKHSSGWCVMLDPDMTIEAGMMVRMMQAAEKLTRGRVTKFALKHVDSGKLDLSSPNTWLIHRDDFFAVGGYDEDFAGNKGWSDVQLLDVLRSCYKVVMRPDLHADFHSMKTCADAMVTSLDRHTHQNRKKRIKKTDQARRAGGWAQWAKSNRSAPRLRFQWTQVC